MFAILWPAALAPLIVTLFWAELKAVKLGYVAPAPLADTSAKGRANSVVAGAKALDVLGLLLLGGAISCILLPLTLARNAKGGWSNREFSIPPRFVPSYLTCSKHR
jgi:hypothetical protein